MVAEKYAITEDLDESVGAYQQAKEQSYDPHAIGLARTNVSLHRGLDSKGRGKANDRAAKQAELFQSLLKLR
jgi:hypothetical protein